VVLLHGDERRPIQIDGQNLEQHVHHGGVGPVVDGVVDVARLEEEIARPIDHRLLVISAQRALDDLRQQAIRDGLGAVVRELDAFYMAQAAEEMR
jgi:hypothetical protein